MEGQVRPDGDRPAVRVPDSELEYDEELVYRWRGELFTGIGYDSTSPDGLSEVSYRYGAQEGPARDWYPSGALKGESQFRVGVPHGTPREWDEDGAVSTEAVFAYGILMSRSERGGDGQLRRVFLLAENNPNGRLLERFRREKGWPESD